MHLQPILVTSLATLVLSFSLEERESYAWITAFDNTDMNCQKPPAANQQYVKLKKENKCYQFSPGTINIGWSWGAGLNEHVTQIKLYSDANCVNSLLQANQNASSSENGYCLTTNEREAEYPTWNPNSPPILSVMAGNSPSSDTGS